MNRSTTAVIVAAASVLLASVAGCSAANGASAPAASASTASASASPTAQRVDAGLGSPPTYLPTANGSTPERGTPEKPALAYPGSPVVVTTPTGDVRVDVDGPTTPPGTKVGADSVTCTFTVTLSGTTTPVSLEGSHFDVLDHAGTTRPVKVTGSAAPTTVAPGERATLTLATTVPSGEGLLRFYPSGNVAAAGWDYVAETD